MFNMVVVLAEFFYVPWTNSKFLQICCICPHYKSRDNIFYTYSLGMRVTPFYTNYLLVIIENNTVFAVK